jgi:hypothetical protein
MKTSPFGRTSLDRDDAGRNLTRAAGTIKASRRREAFFVSGLGPRR